MSTLSRFLKYIQIDSPSDPKSGKIPSSDIQLNVAKCLEEEMNALGLENVHIKDGTIYGILPATPGYEGKQPVGFISHIADVKFNLLAFRRVLRLQFMAHIVLLFFIS